MSALALRRARTPDVPAIHDLIELYAATASCSPRSACSCTRTCRTSGSPTHGGRVVGCGAVHPLWEDIAEIRTVAVDPSVRGQGVGRLLVERLIATVRELGIARVFVLTFERDFFAAFGFREIEGTPVTAEVYAELRSSFDEGVAEFLDLERVKPNTLGNHRMLLELRALSDHGRDRRLRPRA